MKAEASKFTTMTPVFEEEIGCMIGWFLKSRWYPGETVLIDTVERHGVTVLKPAAEVRALSNGGASLWTSDVQLLLEDPRFKPFYDRRPTRH